MLSAQSANQAACGDLTPSMCLAFDIEACPNRRLALLDQYCSLARPVQDSWLRAFLAIQEGGLDRLATGEDTDASFRLFQEGVSIAWLLLFQAIGEAGLSLLVQSLAAVPSRVVWRPTIDTSFQLVITPTLAFLRCGLSRLLSSTSSRSGLSQSLIQPSFVIPDSNATDDIDKQHGVNLTQRQA